MLFFSFVLLFFCKFLFFTVVVQLRILLSLFTQTNIVKPSPEDKTRRRTLLYFDWLIGENQHL